MDSPMSTSSQSPPAPQSPGSGKYHFKNHFADYTENSSKNHIKNSCQISATCSVAQKLIPKWEATKEQLECLKNWTSTDYTIYTGTSGIGLLYLRKDSEDPKNLRKIRKHFLQLDNLANRKISFLCGDAGPLAISAVISYKLQDDNILQFCVKKLMAFVKVVKNSSAELANEILYGRAGFLYSLLYVNKHVTPKPFSESVIRGVVETILIVGQAVAKRSKLHQDCPLMYEWHGTKYLGAAHGLSGIIYMLLQARHYLTQEELNDLIKPSIAFLERLRFPMGNFPSSLGPSKPDKYVQWCHGAPGFLYMFCEAYKTFGDKHYIYAAEKCADVIWFRGILKKGYSLCHGVAGNAYCFLEMFQTTKDEKHLYRAIKFAEYCVDYTKEKEQCQPDRPLSLFEGISGPMYLLLDIQDPLNAKFPGFTL